MSEYSRRSLLNKGLKLAAMVVSRPAFWLAAGCSEFLASCASHQMVNGVPLKVDSQGQVKLIKPIYQCYLESGKIALATEQPVGKQAKISYWKKGNRENLQTVKLVHGWEKVHFAIPENVELSETYNCQLEIDGLTSAIFEFVPGVKKETPFKFLVIGDTRPGVSKPHEEVVEQMEKIKDTSFYIHLGDFVNEFTPMSGWRDFFRIHENLLSRIPILPVIGNHDRSKSMYFSGLFLMKSRSVTPKRYYAVTYGNLKLVTLDSNVPINKDDEQYLFLVEELKKAQEEKVDHIVVALHHPPYSSGKHGTNHHLKDTLSPVFEKYEVKLVVSGHEHQYERTQKINGVVYVVSGGGGSELRNVEPGELTAKALRSFHFVEFQVEGKNMQLTAINHKGHVIDRYAF